MALYEFLWRFVDEELSEQNRVQLQKRTLFGTPVKQGEKQRAAPYKIEREEFSADHARWRCSKTILRQQRGASSSIASVPDIVWMTREATPAELNETPRSSGSQRAERKSLEAGTHFIRGGRRRQRRRCNKRMSQWRSTGRDRRKPWTRFTSRRERSPLRATETPGMSNSRWSFFSEDIYLWWYIWTTRGNGNPEETCPLILFAFVSSDVWMRCTSCSIIVAEPFNYPPIKISSSLLKLN